MTAYGLGSRQLNMRGQLAGGLGRDGSPEECITAGCRAGLFVRVIPIQGRRRAPRIGRGGFDNRRREWVHGIGLNPITAVAAVQSVVNGQRATRTDDNVSRLIGGIGGEWIATVCVFNFGFNRHGCLSLTGFVDARAYG